MEEARRAILRQVASGDLTPEEAARQLDELESRGPVVVSTQIPGERSAKIRVVRTAGWAEIVGDPTVQEAVAEGPHVARRDGDTLVIEGEQDSVELPGFRFSWRRGYQFRFPDVRPLRVRVNPDIPLEVEAQAGSLRVRGVRGPIRAEVQASATRIDGFGGPIELNAQAGSVRASGRLDHGASRIRCEAGSVRLHLERGSSVRVSAHAMLGKISVDGRPDDNAWVIGDGAASLEIEATMGSVRVSSE